MVSIKNLMIWWLSMYIPYTCIRLDYYSFWHLLLHLKKVIVQFIHCYFTPSHLIHFLNLFPLGYLFHGSWWELGMDLEDITDQSIKFNFFLLTLVVWLMSWWEWQCRPLFFYSSKWFEQIINSCWTSYFYFLSQQIQCQII